MDLKWFFGITKFKVFLTIILLILMVLSFFFAVYFLLGEQVGVGGKLPYLIRYILNIVMVLSLPSVIFFITFFTRETLLAWIIGLIIQISYAYIISCIIIALWNKKKNIY